MHVSIRMRYEWRALKGEQTTTTTTTRRYARAGTSDKRNVDSRLITQCLLHGWTPPWILLHRNPESSSWRDEERAARGRLKDLQTRKIAELIIIIYDSLHFFVEFYSTIIANCCSASRVIRDQSRAFIFAQQSSQSPRGDSRHVIAAR